MEISFSGNGMWAISPAVHQRMLELSGDHSLMNSQKATERGGVEPMQLVKGVAVISISGILVKKSNPFLEFLGATSFGSIGTLFNQAIADPGVKAVVLEIDSPGGMVAGTQTLANLIFKARGQKPIVAFIDGSMLSAAAWIGLAAERVVIGGDTDQVGSVGAVVRHTDFSELEKRKGFKITEIVSSLFKRKPNSHEPLDQEGRDVLQANVDHIHKAFITDLARFRGLSFEQANTQLGDGRVFLGEQAIFRGFADEMASFGNLLSRLQEGAFKPAGAISRQAQAVATTERNFLSSQPKGTSTMYQGNTMRQPPTSTATAQPATPALDALHQTPAYQEWLAESPAMRDAFNGNFKDYLFCRKNNGLESLRTSLVESAIVQADSEARQIERRAFARRVEGAVEADPEASAILKDKFKNNPNYPGLFGKESEVSL